jgi:hypothetical protein
MYRIALRFSVPFVLFPASNSAIGDNRRSPERVEIDLFHDRLSTVLSRMRLQAASTADASLIGSQSRE